MERNSRGKAAYYNNPTFKLLKTMLLISSLTIICPFLYIVGKLITALIKTIAKKWKQNVPKQN